MAGRERLGGSCVARVLSVVAVAFVTLGATAGEAKADPAEVTVGPVDDGRFAQPPRGAGPGSAEEVIPDEPPVPYVPPPPERYRSPLRLSVGPAGVTTGQNLGLGLGVGADFGTGTVGARLAAAWLRGDPQAAADGNALGTSLAQYTGELTIDLHKHGPVHPIFGLGFGLVHVNEPTGSGSAGIGTARLGIEYALGLDDADVRLGGSLLGALPGPADREVQDLRGYAMVQAGISIGF